MAEFLYRDEFDGSIPLGGKIVLIRSAEHKDEETPSVGRQVQCREFRIEKVEGDHFSMLTRRGPHSLHNKLPEILLDLMSAAQVCLQSEEHMFHIVGNNRKYVGV